MFRKFPSYHQMDTTDCGPACIQIIAKYFGKYIDLERLRTLTLKRKEGVSAYDISKAAEKIGLKSLIIKTSYKRLLNQIPKPCIIHWNNHHFIVVYKISKKYVWVSDPAQGLIKYTKKEFVNGWLAHLDEASAWRNGVVIALEPTDKFNDYTATSKEPSFTGFFTYLFLHLKPFKNSIRKLLLTVFILGALQFTFPLLTQAIVDVGIGTNDIGFINLILIAHLVLTISSGLGNWIRQSINLHISIRVKVSLLSSYFIKLLSLPMTFFENKLMGDIIQRVNDYERIEEFLMRNAFNIILALFYVLIFGILLSFYDVSLLLIFLFGTVIYIFWILLFWNIRKKMDIKFFSLMGQNNSQWIETLTNIQDIKSNNYEKIKRWRWEKIQVKLYRVATRLLNVSQAESLGGNFLNSARDVLLTYISAIGVVNGDFTFGMMIAVQYIIGQLKGPVDDIINFIKSYQMAFISFNRMNEVNRVQEERSDDVLDQIDLSNVKFIKLENVFFRYQGNNDSILKNISFLIPKGTTTAIVGPSGSGKSTIMKLIAGLYDPSSGNIHLGSHNLKNIDLSDWRQRTGVVTQESTFFNDTILVNITLGKSEENFDEDHFNWCLKSSNLQHDIELLSKGVNTLIGENGRGLSEGQKQRVLLARSLYKRPDFFFFDEITNALDSKNESLIFKTLKEHRKKTTIVIVTHKLLTIQNVDQIIYVDKGQVIEQGSHTELMNRKGAYFKMFNFYKENSLSYEKS